MKKILLGLSGGPDSVYLFYQLLPKHKAGEIELVCAHINHGWRPEAEREEEFCKKLCAEHDIKLLSGHAKNIEPLLPEHHKNNRSQEARGRYIRRYFFEKIAREDQCDEIMLAHHRDDQIETFFIRLIRGSTLDGLTGMHKHEGIYTRPLLDMSKQEILEYLNQKDIPYCIDSSNSDQNYLRNRIRSTVIPALRSIDQRFDHNFSRTHAHLQEENLFLDKLARDLLSSLRQNSHNSPEANKLSLSTLRSFITELSSVLVDRLLIIYLVEQQVPFTPSSGLLEEIRRFIMNPAGGRHEINNKTVLIKQKNVFFATQLLDPERCTEENE